MWTVVIPETGQKQSRWICFGKDFSFPLEAHEL